MRILSILLLACLSLPAFAQIGAKTQSGKIQGIWQNNSFGYQMTLILNADGTGEFDGDAIKYTAKDDKFTMTIVAEAQTTVYNYNLQGNSLTMSGGDLEAPVSFTRGDTEKSSKGEWTVYPPNSNPELIGLWSGNNETIEFTTDGKCNYTGQTHPYTVSGNNVTLQTTQGNFAMAYSVKGNVLSLTVNGQTIQYTKGAPGASEKKNATSRRKTGSTGISWQMVLCQCYKHKLWRKQF